MKKIVIAIVVTIVAIFANNAQAMTETEVAQYVRNTVPEASNFDARMCASAWQHGSTFRAEMINMTLTCEKNRIAKDWDLTSD